MERAPRNTGLFYKKHYLLISPTFRGRYALMRPLYADAAKMPKDLRPKTLPNRRSILKQLK